MPAIAGCEIHDDPLRPVCASCRRRAADEGDALPIVWIERALRYSEKLATPDVTIADLVGEVDPVRVAEGRYLSDEETIHFGLAARSHRRTLAASFVDLDNDGDMDLVTLNDFSGVDLFHNDGKGNFTDESARLDNRHLS